MPIYKVDGKKDGLQKYNVRVNFVSDEGSKQLTRTAYGREAAKELERQLTYEINIKCEKPARKMSVQQLFDEYISIKEARETTIEKNRHNYKYYIQPTMAKKRIDKLNFVQLQEWKSSLQNKGLALNTKKQAFNDFRALLNYAVKAEYLPYNPITKVGNFKDTSIIAKEMNIYTTQEFTKFIGTAKKLAEEKQTNQMELSEWNFYVFFNLAFFTGLRKGEIHALKWSDVDGDYLSVKRSISQRLSTGDIETPPKNKSSIRTIQMPAPLIKILHEQKERQQQLGDFSDDFRIVSAGRCLRNTSIQRRNEKYATLSGLDVIRIHDFRHSHASVLVNAGINIKEISKRLGHARVEETWNTYSHMYPREEERAIEVFNSLLA